jgi:hypothetical protein
MSAFAPATDPFVDRAQREESSVPLLQDKDLASNTTMFRRPTTSLDGEGTSERAALCGFGFGLF